MSRAIKAPATAGQDSSTNASGPYIYNDHRTASCMPRIRIIAPGGAVDIEKLNNGIGMLRKSGEELLSEDDICERHLYFAGEEDRRINELITALHDSAAGVVWAARGGYGTVSVVSHIDVEEIRQGNKVLIGFSDITALHALWQRAGLRSLMAANIVDLPNWSTESRRELYELLHEPKTAVYEGTSVFHGNTVGITTGGNLTVLASMVGTGQLPSWKGCIVLLEDIGERPYRLHRCLNQLLLSGQFSGVRGICLGQFIDCNDPALDYTPLDMLLDVLGKLYAPVMTDLPFGHDASTARAIRLGVPARLDATTGHGRLSVGYTE